jgi:hypothetical protein
MTRRYSNPFEGKESNRRKAAEVREAKIPKTQKG